MDKKKIIEAIEKLTIIKEAVQKINTQHMRSIYKLGLFVDIKDVISKLNEALNEGK